MRMVSAAKLRRAEHAIASARPYAERMRDMLGQVAAAHADLEHPLLEVREPLRTLGLVVVTSDRGLAGAFNANVLKHAEALWSERRKNVERAIFTPVGRKAVEYMRRHYADRIADDYEVDGWVSYAQAAAIARRLAERFEAGEVDQVVIVFSEFVSMLSQKPKAVQLLPFAPAALEAGEAATPYTIEPSPEKLLATLVPKAIEVEVFRALLESQAGEHAARMIAMENATRNTKELIDKLTLDFNRARQAAITKELMEIVTGAEAS